MISQQSLYKQLQNSVYKCLFIPLKQRFSEVTLNIIYNLFLMSIHLFNFFIEFLIKSICSNIEKITIFFYRNIILQSSKKKVHFQKPNRNIPSLQTTFYLPSQFEIIIKNTWKIINNVTKQSYNEIYFSKQNTNSLRITLRLLFTLILYNSKIQCQLFFIKITQNI